MTVSVSTLPLKFSVSGTGKTLSVHPDRLIVAGYTGSDADAVAEHIAELAAIGVPPPATVPAFYDLDPGLLTTDGMVEVAGTDTSGEVEPVIIRQGDQFFLGVGSDHTDRLLERDSIAESKRVCPKPLGSTVVELPSDLTELDWDALRAESDVDGEPYQRGSLSALRTPADVLDRLATAIPDVSGDLVLFGGTLPLLTGGFRYGRRWLLRLELPDGSTLTHDYETKNRNS
jgi:hypothetical protein